MNYQVVFVVEVYETASFLGGPPFLPSERIEHPTYDDAVKQIDEMFARGISVPLQINKIFKKA